MLILDLLAGKGSVSSAFRRGRARARLLWFAGSRYAYLGWVELAFQDFYSQDGPESLSEFRAGVAEAAPKVVKLYEESIKHPEKMGEFAKALLNNSERVATEAIRHCSCKLRSYNDITVAVQIARIFLESLCSLKLRPEKTPADLASLLLEQVPASRTALVVAGQLELARGRMEAALEAARRALAISSACTAAQRLLRQAWMAKVKEEPSAICTEIFVGDLSERFCSKPFQSLATSAYGDTWLCDCGAWLPYSAGDLFRADSVDGVWNSPTAMEIRRSIIDGDFSYCSRTLCPAIVQNRLPKKTELEDPHLLEYVQKRMTRIAEAPRVLQLSHDSTCNLACPSCRKEIMVADAAQRQMLNGSRDRILLPLLRRTRGLVMLTGWGDPFASKHYRSILAALNPAEFPGLQLEIVTNGLLLTPRQWDEFANTHPMISRIKVSIDAATAETYEQVRRPGRWSQLLANLEFLSKLRRNGELKEFWINLVVQKSNFREMLDFIRLGQRLGVDKVFFQKLWNMESVEPARFAEMDVASPSHPLHAELLSILHDPLMQDPIVMASNLQLVFDEAVTEN